MGHGAVAGIRNLQRRRDEVSDAEVEKWIEVFRAEGALESVLGRIRAHRDSVLAAAVGEPMRELVSNFVARILEPIDSLI